MEKSFENIFVHQKNLTDIQKVVAALKKDEPILNLVEGDRGSFSTIFLPFHGGTILESNITFAEQEGINEDLRNFSLLAGKIESLTDIFATYDKEPSREEKEKLLPLLEEFIEKIPTYETFKRWIEDSIKNAK